MIGHYGYLYYKFGYKENLATENKEFKVLGRSDDTPLEGRIIDSLYYLSEILKGVKQR